MERKANSRSIFSQKLDRAIFVTYFLGAIVPLVLLGAAVQSYVLPALQDDSRMTMSMVGGMIGVAMLSLGAFFALRRLSINAASQMASDNNRLKGILSASKELSTSLHVQAVAEIAVSSARSLTSAEVALMLMKASDDKPLVLVSSSGEGAQKLYQDNESVILELVESTLADQTETALGTGSKSKPDADGAAEGLGAALAFPLIAEDGSSGAVVVLNGSTSSASFPASERDALLTLSTLTGVALRNVGLQDAQRNFFAHITELLVAAMDTHIDGRKGHAMAVAQLTNRLAREMAFPESRMQRLHFAALLHDIGMLKIDRAHQRSPGHFQKHPQIAHRALSRIRLWEDVAPIVLYHHEWFDGSGYPEAQAGEDIPLESRIIAVADCYDALIRPGAHRMALSHEAAVREILEHAGTQFDPQVAAALEQLALRGEVTDSAE
ncbi:MAG: HD domain-containing protein [Deltaproteobacteria bacterium]|nr:HD domain-containing protein [Deltaproteobacteria bacterium]